MEPLGMEPSAHRHTDAQPHPCLEPHEESTGLGWLVMRPSGFQKPGSQLTASPPTLPGASASGGRGGNCGTGRLAGLLLCSQGSRRGKGFSLSQIKPGGPPAAFSTAPLQSPGTRSAQPRSFSTPGPATGQPLPTLLLPAPQTPAARTQALPTTPAQPPRGLPASSQTHSATLPSLLATAWPLVPGPWNTLLAKHSESSIQRAHSKRWPRRGRAGLSSRHGRGRRWAHCDSFRTWRS